MEKGPQRKLQPEQKWKVLNSSLIGFLRNSSPIDCATHGWWVWGREEEGKSGVGGERMRGRGRTFAGFIVGSILIMRMTDLFRDSASEKGSVIWQFGN